MFEDKKRGLARHNPCSFLMAEERMRVIDAISKTDCYRLKHPITAYAAREAELGWLTHEFSSPKKERIWANGWQTDLTGKTKANFRLFPFSSSPSSGLASQVDSLHSTPLRTEALIVTLKTSVIFLCNLSAPPRLPCLPGERVKLCQRLGLLDWTKFPSQSALPGTEIMHRLCLASAPSQAKPSLARQACLERCQRPASASTRPHSQEYINNPTPPKSLPRPKSKHLYTRSTVSTEEGLRRSEATSKFYEVARHAGNLTRTHSHPSPIHLHISLLFIHRSL